MLQPQAHLQGLSRFTVPLALHQHDRHTHDRRSVIMLSAGRKSCAVEGRRLALLARRIAVANPGQVHACECVGGKPWARRTRDVNLPLQQQLCSEAGLRHRAEIVLPMIDSAPLQRRVPPGRPRRVVLRRAAACAVATAAALHVVGRQAAGRCSARACWIPPGTGPCPHPSAFRSSTPESAA